MFPFIRVSEQLMLPTYMVVLSLTYCLALLFVFYRAGTSDDGMKRNIALDLAIAIMLGGFVGARVFHVIYELPDFYFQNPYEILKFWRGGFVYYGGFIGAIVTCSIYLRLKKLSFLEWADFYAPVVSLGYALGRIGCFLNGCCFGALCTLPWAVEMSHPGLPLGLRHPTQLYTTLYELGVFIVLITIEKWRPKKRLGEIFYIWLSLHATGRILIEPFRDDDRGPELLGFSISTWLSLVLILIAAAGLLKWKRQPPPSTV